MTERHKLTGSDLTEEQVAVLLRRSGDITTSIELARAECDAATRPAEDRFEAEKSKLETEQESIKAQILGYVETNKHLFKKPKSKRLSYGGFKVGKIGFRKAPSKILIAKRYDKIVIGALTKLRLTRFIIRKPIIDKTGLKKHLLANKNINIRGVTITDSRSEAFFEVNRNPEEPGK